MSSAGLHMFLLPEDLVHGGAHGGDHHAGLSGGASRAPDANRPLNLHAEPDATGTDGDRPAAATTGGSRRRVLVDEEVFALAANFLLDERPDATEAEVLSFAEEIQSFIENELDLRGARMTLAQALDEMEEG